MFQNIRQRINVKPINLLLPARETTARWQSSCTNVILQTVTKHTENAMRYIILLFTFLITLSLYSQTEEKLKTIQFGGALNSNAKRATRSICLAPTGFLSLNRHQIELGLGFYPFDYDPSRTIEIESNYKYFPNGREAKFSLFFLANLTYNNSSRNTPNAYNTVHTTHNLLSLMGGYGFELKVMKRAYLAPSINFGIFTEGRKSTSSDENSNYKMFEGFGIDGGIRLHFGYRFSKMLTDSKPEQ